MPASDKSPTACAPVMPGEGSDWDGAGSGHFATTHWTVVLQAGKTDSPEARDRPEPNRLHAQHQAMVGSNRAAINSAGVASRSGIMVGVDGVFSKRVAEPAGYSTLGFSYFREMELFHGRELFHLTATS